MIGRRGVWHWLGRISNSLIGIIEWMYPLSAIIRVFIRLIFIRNLGGMNTRDVQPDLWFGWFDESGVWLRRTYIFPKIRWNIASVHTAYIPMKINRMKTLMMTDSECTHSIIHSRDSFRPCLASATHLSCRSNNYYTSAWWYFLLTYEYDPWYFSISVPASPFPVCYVPSWSLFAWKQILTLVHCSLCTFSPSIGNCIPRPSAGLSCTLSMVY